jgi:hypothetical protein
LRIDFGGNRGQQSVKLIIAEALHFVAGAALLQQRIAVGGKNMLFTTSGSARPTSETVSGFSADRGYPAYGYRHRPL